MNEKEMQALPRQRKAQKVTRDVITVKEAAHLLGVCPGTSRKMIKSKRLRTVQGLPVVRIELAHLRKKCGLEDPEK